VVPGEQVEVGGDAAVDAPPQILGAGPELAQVGVPRQQGAAVAAGVVVIRGGISWVVGVSVVERDGVAVGHDVLLR
jgi:hypothetical protein